jgi:hypothetical protein
MPTRGQSESNACNAAGDHATDRSALAVRLRPPAVVEHRSADCGSSATNANAPRWPSGRFMAKHGAGRALLRALARDGDRDRGFCDVDASKNQRCRLRRRPRAVLSAKQIP